MVSENNLNAELILVDDGSETHTRQIAEQLSIENENVTTIRLKENTGQIMATMFGIVHAKAPLVITIDDDLQYPMTEILKLIKHYKKSGKKIIFGYPNRRKHSFRHNLAAATIIFFFKNIILPQYRHINFYTSFRIFDKSLFVNPYFPEKTRHLLYVWEIPSSDMASIGVEHVERKSGISTYTFSKKITALKEPLYYAFMKMLLIALAIISAATMLILLFSFEKTFLFYGLASTGIVFALASGLLRMLIRKNRIVTFRLEKIAAK